MAIEDDVQAVLAKLDQEQDPNPQDETDSTEQEQVKRVIHVDKYTLPDGSALFRLPSGEGLLVPGDTTTENPLDENAVESTPTATDAALEEYQLTHTPTVPLTNNGQQDEQPEPTPPSTKQRIKLSFVLVPLVLLCILVAGAMSYFFLMPLTASATITITPKVRSLHSDTTFRIATNPKAG